MQATQEKTKQLPLLTNSSRNTFNTCRRKYLYSYELGYESALVNETLYFGSLMHGALEIYFSNDLSLNLALEFLESERGEWNQYHVAHARALMIGYHAYWTEDNERFKVLAIEEEFRAPLVNPQSGHNSRSFELGGKLDGIIAYDNGEKAILEHKTTSFDISDESDYWAKLSMDGQISGYYVGADVIGHDVELCTYDVIKKTGRRPLLATPPENRKYKKDGSLYANQREENETPDAYEQRILDDVMNDPTKFYVRKTVRRTYADLVEYLNDMWQFAFEVRMARNNKSWPRNPNQCLTFGKCKFWDVCRGLASLEDPLLFERKSRIHMELEEVN